MSWPAGATPTPQNRKGRMKMASSWIVPVLLLSFSAFCFAAYTRKVSYRGEVLVKCSDLERSTVQRLLESDGVDVWHVGREGSMDFRVSSEQFQVMKGDLPGCREAGNVEDIVKREEGKRMGKRNFNQTQQEWFEEYHEYPDIVKWYIELSFEYPNLVKFVESIGQSLEGRAQPAVHITASSTPKPKYYFQCQIHAREWISGATCMYIANFLVQSYGINERVTKLLDDSEFVIIPFVNPDGYAYTWSGDRLWRKNRRPGTPCYGVDLNRNYPDHWAEGGSSSNPCSEVYHGEDPASEPETQHTIDYFKFLTEPEAPIYGGIDWHSYSQLILRPYGWTDEDAPDEDQLRELGAEMSEAIRSVNGKLYTNQKSIGLYPTTGSADDWMYSDDANEFNGEYRAAAYTVELRDTGEYGFLLPPEQIIPTGEEIVAAVLVFAEALNANPLKKQ